MAPEFWSFRMLPCANALPRHSLRDLCTRELEAVAPWVVGGGWPIVEYHPRPRFVREAAGAIVYINGTSIDPFLKSMIWKIHPRAGLCSLLRIREWVSIEGYADRHGGQLHRKMGNSIACGAGTIISVGQNHSFFIGMLHLRHGSCSHVSCYPDPIESLSLCLLLLLLPKY